MIGSAGRKVAVRLAESTVNRPISGGFASSMWFIVSASHTHFGISNLPMRLISYIVIMSGKMRGKFLLLTFANALCPNSAQKELL